MKKLDLDNDFIEDLDVEDEEDDDLYEDDLPLAVPDRKLMIGLVGLGVVIVIFVCGLFKRQQERAGERGSAAWVMGRDSGRRTAGRELFG